MPRPDHEGESSMPLNDSNYHWTPLLTLRSQPDFTYKCKQNNDKYKQVGSTLQIESVISTTTTTKSYLTRWGRLHGSKDAIWHS